MNQQIENLKRQRDELQKAPPFKRADAAMRMFDSMVALLQQIDERLTALEERE